MSGTYRFQRDIPICPFIAKNNSLCPSSILTLWTYPFSKLVKVIPNFYVPLIIQYWDSRSFYSLVKWNIFFETHGGEDNLRNVLKPLVTLILFSTSLVKLELCTDLCCKSSGLFLYNYKFSLDHCLFGRDVLKYFQYTSIK